MTLCGRHCAYVEHDEGDTRAFWFDETHTAKFQAIGNCIRGTRIKEQGYFAKAHAREVEYLCMMLLGTAAIMFADNVDPQRVSW